MLTYTITYSRVRDRRGMPCYGVAKLGEARMFGAFNTPLDAIMAAIDHANGAEDINITFNNEGDH